MRPIRILLVVFSSLAVLVTPLAARAAVYSSCGGAFVSPGAECTLFFAGDAFSVSGEVDNIYINVTISDETTNTDLMSCTAVGASYSTYCSASGGFSLTPDLMKLKTGVPLTCRVFGQGSGQYSCASFSP